MAMLAAAASESAHLWPFAVLLISLAAIIVMITVLRVHAFLALILAAILAGLLADKLPGEYGTLPNDPGKEQSHWVRAVELTASEFGTTAGKIAIVIALASMIGMCLMQSGAADKVVRVFIRWFGERRAGAAVAASSYLLSIPIFFDTFFMLLLPLAKALRLRTGRDYILYVMAICCGGTVTHSLLAPHPGPLAMAEALKVDLGLTIVVGVVAGILPTMASWFTVKWINRRMEIPLRDAPGSSLEELGGIARKEERELPSFVASLLPVVLPIFLISLASVFASVKGLKEAQPVLYHWVEFAGNRNVALFVGAIFAIILLLRQQRLTLTRVNELAGPPFETAGVIILITSAGGAFGLMLKNAGVGEAIQALVAGREINLLLLSWAVAAVIRVAQGSATVAMLTTAAMIQPMIAGGNLPYHPVYIFMAIGFGAMMLSWMNDSGFWVVGRLSGFTEKETLKTWTVVVTVNSLAGLVLCLVAATIVPLKGL